MLGIVPYRLPPSRRIKYVTSVTHDPLPAAQVRLRDRPLVGHPRDSGVKQKVTAGTVKLMLLTHAREQGVLVMSVHHDPGVDGRAALLTEITDLVHACKPAPVVIILEDRAATGAALSVVLRAHQLCSGLGIMMSVATHSAMARRMLQTSAEAGGIRLVVHARADTAITTTAYSAAA